MRRGGIWRTGGATSRLLAPTRGGAPSLLGSCSRQLSSHRSWGNTKNKAGVLKGWRREEKSQLVRVQVWMETLTSVFHCRWVFAAEEGCLLSPPPFLLCAPPSFQQKTKSWGQHCKENTHQCVAHHILPCLWARCQFLFLFRSESETTQDLPTSASAFMKVLWWHNVGYIASTTKRISFHSDYRFSQCVDANCKVDSVGLQTARNKAARLVLGKSGINPPYDKK